MTDDILSARISKLPEWARDHIDSLTRQRDDAKAAVERYLSEQTVTPYYEDATVQTGRLSARRYIDAHRITCVSGTLSVTIYPAEERSGIQIQWDSRKGAGQVAIAPQSSNVVRITELRD